MALVFGGLTIVSGGSVLFGGEAIRAQAGDVVPLVVWFNFAAGFAYVVAGFGIWKWAHWAFPLSVAIAVATLAVAAVFALLVLAGTAFEMRTVAALTLRFFIWASISALIRPRRT
ncbi:hypothetical protein [Thalassovita aquimarina]|uniref:hypothetical protein n=1 Tax=Thalassovita aquimarina TaxID=2785917 RepID=UPI001FE98BDC|nr:hypothetical protein [Thalassovita aquimarina]